MSNESEYKLREEVRRLHQKLAEKEVELTAVKRSERKYRHLFEKSPTMIYVIDQKGETPMTGYWSNGSPRTAAMKRWSEVISVMAIILSRVRPVYPLYRIGILLSRKRYDPEPISKTTRPSLKLPAVIPATPGL